MTNGRFFCIFTEALVSAVAESRSEAKHPDFRKKNFPIRQKGFKRELQRRIVISTAGFVLNGIQSHFLARKIFHSSLRTMLRIVNEILSRSSRRWRDFILKRSEKPRKTKEYRRKTKRKDWRRFGEKWWLSRTVRAVRLVVLEDMIPLVYTLHYRVHAVS